MPNISVLKKSNYLKKEDCDPPILVTIRGCTEENVAKEGAPEELRWCLHFNELEKPMVLNATNGQIIAGFSGHDNTDDWPGVKVVLYHDPNVSFGGKLIGGIRCRAPRIPKAPAPKAPVLKAPVAPSPEPPPEVEEEDPEVPF